MENKPDKNESFLERNIGILFVLLIVIVFGGYLVFSWYNPEPMPDCGYSDKGCQGDTSRYGQ